MMKIIRFLQLFRVKHYIKNLLIFLPVFLAGEMLNLSTLIKVVLGFIIFSLTASVIYVINDIRDVDADRIHPQKKSRPIASGAITIVEAKISILLLFVISVMLAFLIEGTVRMLLIPAIYMVINLCYSMGLKNYPLVDISILSAGYMLRLYYGGICADTEVSTWIFLTMMSAAFFMGFGKRRGELVEYGAVSRGNLRLYKEEFLNQGMTISCTLSIVFYAMACADRHSVVASNGIDLLWSVPIIVIILYRYLMVVTSDNNDGDPVTVILNDKLLLILISGFALILFILLYL